jgi:poly-gamma-glutamate capsule biosynthesis protein CapA/YwtB (metallophosphatase superfamily)
VIPCESADSRTVTLVLCGDVMTGRGVDQILPHPSSPALHEAYVRSALEYVEMAERANGRIPRAAGFSYIWGDAIGEFERLAPGARIVNLETSITTCEDYDPKGINYRMHPANTPCLTAAKIDCCVLANNHVMDWGRLGLAETLAALKAAGVKTAGAMWNRIEAAKPAVIDTGNGARVLVFAAGMEDSGIRRDCAATDTDSGVAVLPDLSDGTVESVAELVRAVKRPRDIAVLSIHWGGNWGYSIPRQQREFAHHVLDRAGIDVIHGHSSHHPKGIEVYRGKPILYGCGDFLNDYEGISGYEEYRSSLVLMYCAKMDQIDGRLIALELTPFEIKRFRLSRAAREDAQWLRDMLDREGKRLDTQAVLNAAYRLILEWR